MSNECLDTVIHKYTTYIKTYLPNYFLARLQLPKNLLKRFVFVCASVSHGTTASITIKKYSENHFRHKVTIAIT